MSILSEFEEAFGDLPGPNILPVDELLPLSPDPLDDESFSSDIFSIDAPSPDVVSVAAVSPSVGSETAGTSKRGRKRKTGTPEQDKGAAAANKKRAVTPEESLNEDNMSNMSPDEVKKLKRLIKNRESAQLSRDKKKAYVSMIEARVAELETENQMLRSENMELKRKLGLSGSSFLGGLGGSGARTLGAAGVMGMFLLSFAIFYAGLGVTPGHMMQPQSPALSTGYAQLSTMEMGAPALGTEVMLSDEHHGRSLLSIADADGASSSSSPSSSSSSSSASSIPSSAASSSSASSASSSSTSPSTRSRPSVEEIRTDLASKFDETTSIVYRGRTYVLCDKARSVFIEDHPDDVVGSGSNGDTRKPIISIVVPSSSIDLERLASSAVKTSSDDSSSDSASDLSSVGTAMAPFDTLALPQPSSSSSSKIPGPMGSKISKRYSPLFQPDNMVEIRCQVLNLTTVSSTDTTPSPYSRLFASSRSR